MVANIHQEVSFEASPARVYMALTDAKEFSAFTGAPAEIDGREGGAFSMFGGMITGRAIEAIAGKRLVQAWRAGNWPEGAYSIVRFELTPAGTGTMLTLDHDGYPAQGGEHLDAGWQNMYWAPLRKYLG